jgi:hypothetical protein
MLGKPPGPGYGQPKVLKERNEVEFVLAEGCGVGVRIHEREAMQPTQAWN